jgi:hypothetical protein
MLASVRRLIVAASLLALLLAGCGGGGSKTNGEEKKAPAQVVADAQQAVAAASIVHVVGKGVTNGQPLKLDLWVADGKGKGHIEEAGLAFDVVRIGNTVYIRGSDAFWKRFAGAAGVALLHDKWVKAPVSNGEIAAIAPLTDKTKLFKAILAQHGKIQNKGAVDYQGQKAVEIRDTTQGGSLYVADTGTPYPLAVKGGASQGNVTFSGWNGAEPIAAPKGALDFSKAGG